MFLGILILLKRTEFLSNLNRYRSRLLLANSCSSKTLNPIANDVTVSAGLLFGTCHNQNKL